MNVIKPTYEIMTPISDGGIEELKRIEKAARTCYKSENNINDDGSTAKILVSKLISSKHEAMLEHSILSVKFIVDRGVSHELVRHRLFSFAQESQRYCNYSKDKFNHSITFIEPCFFVKDTNQYLLWYESCLASEKYYFHLINCGATPQEARTVLPNSTKTEIVVTGNYREWRHFFSLRCDKAAHPQMREIANQLLDEVAEKIPLVFDDIKAVRECELSD